MEEDDLYYLAPGFEPASLTVPRLRNILLTHDVEYPSNAKKPQLLELFNDEVIPQAKKLLSAQKRVKRSARGIVDVPSSQASTVGEDDLPEPEPEPAPTRTTRRGTRRTTQSTELDSEATIVAPEAARSRRTTARNARSADPEPTRVRPEPIPTPAPAPKRRGRPSTKTPKQESPDPDAWSKPAEDSPFTADNPFQSGGSSPPPEARKISASRRRTVEPTTERKQSTALSRRRTDGLVAPKAEQVQRSVFDVPLVRSSRKKSPIAGPEQEIVPAGEEFAPEEALELAEQEASGQIVRSARKRSTKSSSLVLQAVLWPLVISAGFLSTLWVQEKYSVGYCGVGNAPITQLRGVEIPEWADAIRPHCEPCPEHAQCYQHLITKCDDDYVLKHHPLTLGGFLPIPLPPTCEPDSEKARRVQFVVERAVDVLRDRNAAFECGEPLPGETRAVKSPAMTEDELRATLSAKRTKRMSQEEFDALFQEAIPEIMNRDEVVSVESTGDIVNDSVPTNLRTGHLRSTSRAKQSLSCAIRTSLRLLLLDFAAGVRRKLADYFWPLVLIALLSGSSFYGKRRIEWRRTEEEWAKDLARQAFDRLSTHATLHAEDPNTYHEPFLLVSHLRDQILAEDITKKWVQDLWAKTVTKVKKNSNVRELNQEMRKGDYGLTWEWIGPLAALPDGASGGSRRLPGYTGGSRKSTGRYSIMPASSPLSGLSTVPADEDGRAPEMSERKWEESRPIY